MISKFLFSTGFWLLFFGQCVAQEKQFSFQKIFSVSPYLAQIANAEEHQVQIIYTQINRDKNNKPSFTSYEFGVNEELYFYPASTVKMPTAFLALQQLNELQLPLSVKMKTGANRFVQTAVAVDTSSVSNLPSVAHYIKKLFVVSDNDAYNRLYELLGQDYINTELHEKGFTNSFIKHRLVGGYDGIENQYVNPVWLYENDSILYHSPGGKRSFAFPEPNQRKLLRGKGYWNGEQTVYAPFQFAAKNSISLQNLHDQLQAVLFPEWLPAHQQFHLSPSHYSFLYEWMSKLPRQSKSPYYNLPDNYVKYILFGDEADEFTIPDHIKVYNKVGSAYGFLTDVAYVIDTKEEVEFLLAVQLLVNENDIFNDGVYEYDEIGRPFMGKLGKAIHQFEINRNRTITPDFSKFLVHETNHSSN